MNLNASSDVKSATDHQVKVSTRTSSPGAETNHFQISRSATLLELMVDGAKLDGIGLLPTATGPFDKLHNLHGDQVGPPIQQLDETVGEFVDEPKNSKQFFIELVLAFRVNTRWAIAPQAELTPRQILALPQINLNPDEYTLYAPGSNVPLPIDTPVVVKRGSAFEAQRDGRYGEGL